MWKQLGIEEIDDRTTVATFEGTISGQKYVSTVAKYRNKDGSFSLSSALCRADCVNDEKRTIKKEK